MTHNQTLAALDRFEATIGQLSQAYPHEVDFWPAFATYANELEATSPLTYPLGLTPIRATATGWVLAPRCQRGKKGEGKPRAMARRPMRMAPS